MKDLIYMDNAATTRCRPEVVDVMLPYFTQDYGNASAVYDFGAKSKEAMERARDIIAKGLHTKADTIYFTAGGSESDNWAIRGVGEACCRKGRHIITSAIEHHAVIHTCQWMERQGFDVTYLGVDDRGRISLEELEHAIREDTILISIMFANNEIGTIEPIRQIAQIAHRHGILFHTDAVQAFGQIPIDVEELQIDLLSASAHKFSGPKGVGFLYARGGLRLPPLIHGGAQEQNRRAGTENIPGIVGMGEAARIAVATMEERAQHERVLRDYLMDRILAEVPYSMVNGDRINRLPGNANFCFRFIEGEALLLMLDMKGICASAASACASGSASPSHVLLALGLPAETARGSLRLTLGGETTKEEVDYVVDTMRAIVERLRSMSPSYEVFCRSGMV